MAKIAIYGGTFDPIHKGHLHVISEVISRNLADRILVIPAGQPQLRDAQTVASPTDRRAMCQIALKDLAAEVASKVEVKIPSKQLLRAIPAMKLRSSLVPMPSPRLISGIAPANYRIWSSL